jgi:broad specificity phosphatase PhoE
MKKHFVSFIIIRHGETEHNKEKMVQGQYDSNLSKKGEEQAKKVGKRITNENNNIDLVFTSSLKRAKSTATEIHNQLEKKFDKKINFIESKFFIERGILLIFLIFNNFYKK